MRSDEETVVGAGAAPDEESTRQIRRDEDTVVRRDEDTVVGAGAATEEEPTRRRRE
jgi:hypothetical protein